MKIYSCIGRLSLWMIFATCASPEVSSAQAPDPWTAAQLVEPAILARALEGPVANRPVILDVGPAGLIAGAREMGPAHEDAGLKKLKETLQTIPRDREVVVYCGCCPFAKCPNVRPAFRLLLEMGFRNPRLLDLPDNLKKDWIDRGYPLAGQ